MQRKRAERALERTSLDTFKDPDVREEANRMIKRCQAYKNAISCQESISDEQRYAIEIYGMTKNYRRGCIKAKGALAVNNLWLGIQKGRYTLYIDIFSTCLQMVCALCRRMFLSIGTEWRRKDHNNKLLDRGPIYI